MKQLQCIPLLALILCLSVNVQAQNQIEFKDSFTMSPTVAEAVARLAQAQVLEGYPDGYFRPHRTLTRREMACLILRFWNRTDLFSKEPKNTTVSALLAAFSPSTKTQAADEPQEGFKDTDWNHWEYPCEVQLNKLGLTYGYTDGYYRGKRTVTRIEFAVLLSRLVERRKSAPEFDIEQVRFTDVNGDEWYFGATLITAGTGLMQGYADRTFRPHQPVTRGEFAVILARLFLPDRR